MQHWRKTALAVLLAFSVTAGSVVPVYAEESTMAEEALTKTIGYVFVDETEAALPGNAECCRRIYGHNSSSGICSASISFCLDRGKL